ncbi:MAG: hypothetical protein RLY35_159 [Bacteroidota bacterium]|jgi:outer membrane protein W
MKNSIKAFAILVFMVANLSSFSQFSVGVGGGIFRNDGSGNDSQLGPQIQLNYNVTDNIRIGAHFGYYKNSTDFLGTKISIISMPVSLSAEYAFMTDAISPYAGIDVGMLKSGISSDGNSEFGDGMLNIAPKLGINYNINDSWGLNLHGKYHFLLYDGSQYNALSFNLGVIKNF